MNRSSSVTNEPNFKDVCNSIHELLNVFKDPAQSVHTIVATNLFVIVVLSIYRLSWELCSMLLEQYYGTLVAWSSSSPVHYLIFIITDMQWPFLDKCCVHVLNHFWCFPQPNLQHFGSAVKSEPRPPWFVVWVR